MIELALETNAEIPVRVFAHQMQIVEQLIICQFALVYLDTAVTLFCNAIAYHLPVRHL